MIVLDTSIWIEFLKQNPVYCPKVKELLEDKRVLAVECIFGELLQGAKDNREVELLTGYWENLPQCSTRDVWIDAGKLSSEKKLFSKGIGLIDCAIIVSARRYYAQIWSLDKRLNSILEEKETYAFPEIPGIKSGMSEKTV